MLRVLWLWPMVQGGGAPEPPAAAGVVLGGQAAEGGRADGGVGGGVDVDLDLRAAGPVADASAHLHRARLRVRQVVEASKSVGQQAHVRTAEAETPPLGSPLARHQPRALFRRALLVADRLVGVEVGQPSRLHGRPDQESQQGEGQGGQ